MIFVALPIVGLCCFVLYVLFVRWKAEVLRDKLGYKGPPVASRLTGNFPQLQEATDRHKGKTYMAFEEWRQQYGDVYAILEGRVIKVVFADPDCAQEVLVKHTSFTDRMELALDEVGVFYPSIIHHQGEAWKNTRSLLTPVFSSGKLKLISNVVQEKSDKFLENISAALEDRSKATLDIYDLFQSLTTDVIGKAAFAIETKSLSDPTDPFKVLTRDLFLQFAKILESIPFVFTILFPEVAPLMCPLRRFTGVGRAERKLHDHVYPVIQQRKKQVDSFQGVDVMQILIEQQQDLKKQQQNGVREHVIQRRTVTSLSDNEIIANAAIFLLAGYETTSTALGFSAWLLAKHTDVQRKLQAEIDDLLGSAERVDYETVMHKMPYLDAVYNECLRVQPPVTGFVVRKCVRECDVRGHKMMPGMLAMIPTASMHMNESLWKNALEFNPERFLHGAKHHPMAWLPFGAGPRNCIGLRFAEMEYKIALCKLLRRFNIALGPSSEDPLNATDQGGIIHRPLNGVIVDVTAR